MVSILGMLGGSGGPGFSLFSEERASEPESTLRGSERYNRMKETTRQLSRRPDTCGALPMYDSHLDRSFPGVFRDLRRSSDAFWQSIDGYTSSWAMYLSENFQIVTMSETTQLDAMRNTYAMSQAVLGDLQAFMKGLNIRTKQFRGAVQLLRRQIMRLGLDLLPDELLVEIVDLAADNLDELIALSSVCKRFRSVILSSRVLWRDFWLDSSWSPERIRIVAKASGFKALRAQIHGDSLQGPQLASTKAILSLCSYLAELEVIIVNSDDAKRARKLLNGLKMERLQALKLTQSSPISHFHYALDMPSLQTLETSFVPLPSLGRQLVRCTLCFPFRYEIRMKDLVAFLSSASSLQDLVFSLDMAEELHEQDTVVSLQPITMSSLTSFELHYSTLDYQLQDSLLEKIRFTAIRRLVLRPLFYLRRITPLLGSMSSSPMLLNLEVSTLYSSPGDMDDLGDIFASMPETTEILTVSSQSSLHIYALVPDPNWGDPRHGIFDAHHSRLKAHGLRLIRFVSCTRISHNFLVLLRKFFQDVGHTALEIEFAKCDRLTDGVYTLNTMQSAFHPA